MYIRITGTFICSSRARSVNVFCVVRTVLTSVEGAAEDMAHSSLRFGIGRFTTEAEIDFVIGKIVTTVQRLRDMSPLWEMVQEGIDINTINWAQH
jgi:cysteine sulfinate desulfinase/cysteine desulfurase-like protein